MSSTEAMAPGTGTDGVAPGAMELKVAFAVDTTGSQQSNIDAIKNNLKAIHAELLQSARSVEVGMVLYKDHEQGGTPDEYVVKTMPFTSDAAAMASAMDGITACGGGDTPEAVATAMHAVLQMDWGDAATGSGEQSTRVVIWFSDAPPHGLGSLSDVFPNGEPNGHDATALIAEFARRNIRVNVAACGAMTWTHDVGNAFFRKFAADTAGTFVNMSGAAQLAGVITASTVESVQLNRAASEVRVKLETMGVHAAEDLEGLDGERAEMVDALFRSASASDPVLTRCDAEICAVDRDEATKAATACVAEVAEVKTDKEFAAAFDAWRGPRFGGARRGHGGAMLPARSPSVAPGGDPVFRSCVVDDIDIDDGDATYRSLAASLTPEKRAREAGEDAAHPYATPLGPRRERTASRLRNIVMGTIPESTRSAP